MSTKLNTTELISNTVGYTLANTARRAFTTNGSGPVVVDGTDNGPSRNRFKFEMRNIITGAVTDVAWQMGGKKFTNDLFLKGDVEAANFGAPAAPTTGTAATFGPDSRMARVAYWTVFGYAIDRLQGGKVNFLGALIDGIASPMIGEQIAKMMPSS
jgi:hypothetical protein